MQLPTIHVSLFASGSGSNALAIMRYFRENPFPVRIRFSVFCNNPEAGIVEKARRGGAEEVILFNRNEFKEGAVLQWLQERDTQLIVLAGFLWLVPAEIVRAFPYKILNIHPALLPKYGGKGMYGMHVHEAVLAAGDLRSGITIHYVNEQYDQGAIVLQAGCEVLPSDTAETLQKRIQSLEHKYYPSIVAEVLASQFAEPIAL